MTDFKQSPNRNSQGSQDFLEGTELRGSESLEIIRTVEDLAKSIESPRNPDFWQRRFAMQKAAVEGDLSAKANLVTGRVRHTQKLNRNIAPGRLSMGEIMGVAAEDSQQANKAAEDHMPPGEGGRCALFCQRPGRMTCKFCKGEGFEAAWKARMRDQVQKAEDENSELKKQLKALTKVLLALSGPE
jgi:hypothetical protein